jgi:hypothetical protein
LLILFAWIGSGTAPPPFTSLFLWLFRFEYMIVWFSR